MTDDIHRTLGQHDASIAGLQADMQELKSDVKIIMSTLSEAKGGWKTLMMVGGAAGVVGAAGTRIAEAMGIFPK